MEGGQSFDRGTESSDHAGIRQHDLTGDVLCDAELEPYKKKTN